MKIDWTKHFDQIFCILFLPNYEERHQRLDNELKRVDIIDSGIFQYVYTFLTPFQNILKAHVKSRFDDTQAMFNSILAHYRCYKIAQSMNYERVLILEDDVMFLKQKKMMSDILEASPSSDVVLYDKFTCTYKSLDQHEKDNAECHLNSYFVDFTHINVPINSAACYSLSKKAIDVFVRQQEKLLYRTDELWNNYGDNVECNQLTKAYATRNLAKQVPFATGNNSKAIDGYYSNNTLNFDDYEA